jgi:hypothetical protein
VSPSIDLDKSLKPNPQIDSSRPNVDAKPHVLAAQPAGITKKSKNKHLKRQQRLRHIKGIERAEDVIDKLELKRARSAGKDKKVRERKKGWEEVNGEKRRTKGNAFDALDDVENNEQNERKDRDWISDEDMSEVEGGAIEDNVALPEISGEVKELVIPASIPLPIAPVEGDEML